MPFTFDELSGINSKVADYKNIKTIHDRIVNSNYLGFTVTLNDGDHNVLSVVINTADPLLVALKDLIETRMAGDLMILNGYGVYATYEDLPPEEPDPS